MNKTPSGYDAICEWCEAAYVYKYPRAIKVKAWKKYCSNYCEEHNTVYITPARRRRNRNTTARLLELGSTVTPAATVTPQITGEGKGLP